MSGCRNIKIVAFSILALISSTLQAATNISNPLGGSGNYTSWSAEVLKQNEMVFYSQLGMLDFINSSTHESEIRLNAGFYVGVTKNIEGGFGFSSANNLTTLSAGLRYFTAYGKYRISGSREDGSATALSIYSSSAEETADTSIASGADNNRLELTYSTFEQGNDYHYAVSTGQRDYKVTGASNFVYQPNTFTTFSASRMIYTESQRIYELGLTGERTSVSGVLKSNVFAVLGVHFKQKDDMRYTFGSRVALPSNDEIHATSFYFGFNYAAIYPRRSPSMDKMEPKSKAQTATKMPEAKIMPKVMPPVPKAEMQKEKPCIKLDIIDVSGIRGLGMSIAQKLNSNGYCVGNIQTGSNTLGYYSQLYYRKGKEQEAKELVKSLSITGEVSQRKLTGEAELRLIVGRDLSENNKP